MSEAKHMKGLLYPIILTRDVETSAKLILEIMGEYPEPGMTAREQLVDASYNRFHITDNQIYLLRLDKCIYEDWDYVVAAEKNELGTIEISFEYAINGLEFVDALNAELEKLEP